MRTTGCADSQAVRKAPEVPDEAVALVCDRMLTAAIGEDWRQRAPEAVTAFWMDEVREALIAVWPTS